MPTILDYLRQQSEGDLLPWPAQIEASLRYGTGIAAVEELALRNQLLPARYQRNRTMISTEKQLNLFQSTVAVIGCGGLGGYVLEELARLGVGTIIAVDPDHFVEHNQNRQLLASLDSLGKNKVEAAQERIAAINPAVTVRPCPEAFGAENADRLLDGCSVVVDCLDNIETRLTLAAAASRLGIPMVHGAIAGWYGQVCTILPGDTILERIYPPRTAGKGVESRLGNPSFTPAVVASLEVTEVCKLLLKEGELLRNRMLHVDLWGMDFSLMEL